jgi:multiple RNA-binding domain-containing protein 1
MGHPTKKTRGDTALNGSLQPDMMSELPPAVLEAGDSDDEYEDIPARHPKRPAQGAPVHVDATPAAAAVGETPAPVPPDEPTREVPQVSADATDDDWLRSRTSRLLDLVDPDDPEYAARPSASVPIAAPPPEPQDQSHDDSAAVGVEQPSGGAAVRAESSKDAAKLVEKTSRLFLRNLSYHVTEDDIRQHFGRFGSLEEVSIRCLVCFLPGMPARPS